MEHPLSSPAELAGSRYSWTATSTKSPTDTNEPAAAVATNAVGLVDVASAAAKSATAAAYATIDRGSQQHELRAKA